MLMNWAQKLLGITAKPVADGFSDLEIQPVVDSGRLPKSDAVFMQAAEPSFTGYRRAAPGTTPRWCWKAFRLERSRDTKERTDWGFVTPVWILMALVCVISQAALFQWAYAVFA